MSMKKILCLLLAILMLATSFAGCSQSPSTNQKEFQSFEDFESAKLGVLTGSEYDRQTQVIFPNSEMFQYYDFIDLLLSLETDKIDGFLTDSAFYSAIGWEREGYKAIQSDKTTPVNYAFMLSRSEMAKKILPELDAFITQMKSSGRLAQLVEKWFSGKKPTEFEDYSTLTGENGTISVALSDSDIPFSYISENKAKGFDVEIMIAFAREYGYQLEFKDVDFGAKLAGIETNKYDVGIGDITVTDERREEMNFTVSYYEGNLVMVTKGTSGSDSAFSSLSNKKIGVVTGSIQAIQLPKLIPGANYVEFNAYADLITAFDANKVDAFSTDESIYKAMLWEGQKVTRVDQAIDISDYGMIFTKGKDLDLQNKVNGYIESIKENGTHKALEDKWFGDSEPTEFDSYDDLSGEKGTLRIGVNTGSKPFVYLKNGKYAGFEVEMMIGFCREYGYQLEFEDTAFAGILTGVAAAKYDIGMSGITITDERRESVDFSAVNHTEDLVVVLHQAANTEQSTGIEKLSDLAGKKVGVMTGSIQAVMMPQMIPDAVYMEFNSISDLIAALNSNKIDAFGCDESLYTSMLWEGQAVDRIDEPLGSSNYGIIFGKDQKLDLQSELNAYIAKIKADGSLDALEEKWFGQTEPTEFASYDDLDGTNGTITVAINSASMPFVYLKNNQFVGFDVEFVTGFAKEYGYKVEFEDTAFAAILGGVQSGKYDIGMSGITITEERKESLDFSDTYHVEDLAVIIRDQTQTDDLAQFNGATLGVVTGSLYGGYSREQFPNATIKEFNTFADVLVALKGGKVDGIMLDKPNFNSVARTDKSLECITVPAYSVEIGFGFQKNDAGNALQAQMNAFLAKLKAEGKIDELIEKWYGKTEPAESIPLEDLAGDAKTLNVAIDTTRKPFVYMYEGKPVGFEIEVLYMFCKEYGYNVNISDISFASGLAGLASEKYDLVCGGLYMTDERKESVNFSDPYMNAEVVMAKCERSGFESFMLSLRDSFEKTFVREQRWKLIVEGVCTTLIISIFSVLGGTLLGFALYMMARCKYDLLSKLAKAIAKIYTTIIAGTPTLVVLMILFYIVFTSPDMSGVVVAVVGFTLTFGAYVYDSLTLTVSGVDNGQVEAAYALGYSRNKTFFRIVLPQAMRMFVPGYSGEIVSLVKATSVVGYIAVNDLTKMGDIIRGNTYEAFFPLIAVALIYFAITWIIALLMDMVRKKTDPKRRKNKSILRGIVR